jgi:hypothetical protein
MRITIGDFTAVYNSGAYLSVRLCVRLDDKIDGDILKVATEKTAKRYPYFCVKFARNEREYYLEDNPLPVMIINKATSTRLLTEEVNFHAWAVCYKDDFIYFDVYHGLADGNHMYRMLSTLLYYYMSERYGDVQAQDILTLDVPITDEEIDDPIEKLFAENNECASYSSKKTVEQHAAFKCVEDGGSELGEHIFYDIAIPEAEFVRFASENGATPGNMITLLMARAIASVHPASDKPPVGYYFINCRPMLGVKNSSHNCISMVRIEYSKEIQKLDFKEQCRLYRKTTRTESSPEVVRKSMTVLASKVNSLMQLPTIEDKEKAVDAIRAAGGPFSTYGVSYVGKWKYSSIEKHVREFWTHVVGRSEISIEIAAVAGNIFISYQQGIKDESYVDAFMNQLNSFGIPVKLVRKMPVDVEKITEKVI